MSAEADIARARRKPIPKEKIQELLKKARKGATASFSFSKMVGILDALDWQIEASYGWTPLHRASVTGNKEELFVAEYTKYKPGPNDIVFIENKRSKLIDESVSSLPEAGPGTIGKHVIMDVGPMKIGSDDIRYFERREWVGSEGVTITSPRGHETEFLPDGYDLGRSKSVTDLPSLVGSAWRWFKEVGIEDDIAAALGVEKHIPAEMRTRENTGTCAHCWGNYKLEGGRLVLHGYKRPRWGYVVGECRGVRREPLEKSVNGAKDCLESLHRTLDEFKKTLDALESGEIVEIEVRKGLRSKQGEPSFEHHLKESIRRTKDTIKEIEREVTLYEKVISAWRERPMPKEGELQRGPGFFTK